MIKLRNWGEIKKDLSDIQQIKIVNDLIRRSVIDRRSNTNCFSYKKDDCVYNEGWYLHWNERPCDIYEFSFNCLKLSIFRNNVVPENYKFFKNLDLFFFHLKNNQLIDCSKIHWIERMRYVSLEVNEKKTESFCFNLDQYLEKENILSFIMDSINDR